MDSARYSKQALDALPPGSPELKRRLAELAVDVKIELHATLSKKFAEIIVALNAVGHDLRETSQSKPGEIDYAQGEKPNPFYLCCDTTISSGYLGASVCDASIEEQLQWEKDWADHRLNQPIISPLTARPTAPSPASPAATPTPSDRE